jgi:hypothetical protein
MRAAKWSKRAGRRRHVCGRLGTVPPAANRSRRAHDRRAASLIDLRLRRMAPPATLIQFGRQLRNTSKEACEQPHRPSQMAPSGGRRRLGCRRRQLEIVTVERSPAQTRGQVKFSKPAAAAAAFDVSASKRRFGLISITINQLAPLGRLPVDSFAFPPWLA